VKIHEAVATIGFFFHLFVAALTVVFSVRIFDSRNDTPKACANVLRFSSELKRKTN